jgi:hypothetical protein
MKTEKAKHCYCTTISKLPTNVLPVEQMFLKGYNAALTYQGGLSSNHADCSSAQCWGAQLAINLVKRVSLQHCASFFVH